jgi:hypothetical protein
MERSRKKISKHPIDLYPVVDTTRRESMFTTYFPGIEEGAGQAGLLRPSTTVLNVPAKEIVVSSYLLLIPASLPTQPEMLT